MKDRHKNRGGHNKIDLTDKPFGKLTVVKDTGKRKSRRPIWLCRCECGKEVEILGKYLLCGDTKSCGCITKGNAHNRTGYKNLNGSYYGNVKRSAIKRGIPFEITPQEMLEVLEKQNYLCAFSKKPIKIVDNIRDQRDEQTASLDRIDNNKGYTKDNVQWVHKVVNIMRNKLEVADFIGWCKIIASLN